MSVRRGSQIIAGLPIIDGELNETSVRPVQNKAIKAALNEKQNKLIAGDNIVIENDVISSVGGAVLYSEMGQNTDGAMTQKAATDSFLNINQITNCITYIPQDIKLELNNGTLTHLAGSKFYSPDNTSSSASSSSSITSSTNGQHFVYCAKTSGVVQAILNTSLVSRAGSGSSLPADGTTYSVFFNTSDNKIYRYSSNAWSVWSVAFPLAIVTVSNGAISSIDQVFNGFGYIGSTVFALPGVKGLIPNGRNADGSLKNIDVVLDKVLTKNYTYSIYNGYIFLVNNDVQVGVKSAFLTQDDQPTIGTSYERWFSPKENQEYYHTAGGTEWIKTNTYLIIGDCNVSGSPLTVSFFQPKTTFHALDYNEADFVIAFQRPTAHNNYTWYRKYKSGWVEQGGFCNATQYNNTTVNVTFPIIMADTNYSAIANPNTPDHQGTWAISARCAVKTTTNMCVHGSNNASSAYTGVCTWQVAGMAAQ